MPRFPTTNSTGSGEKFTLKNWLNEEYIQLLNDGWRLNDIDEMDINFYIDLLLYKANKEIKDDVKALDDAGL